MGRSRHLVSSRSGSVVRGGLDPTWGRREGGKGWLRGWGRSAAWCGGRGALQATEHSMQHRGWECSSRRAEQVEQSKSLEQVQDVRAGSEGQFGPRQGGERGGVRNVEGLRSQRGMVQRKGRSAIARTMNGSTAVDSPLEVHGKWSREFRVKPYSTHAVVTGCRKQSMLGSRERGEMHQAGMTHQHTDTLAQWHTRGGDWTRI
jgi:hypothetical protein